MLEEKRLNLDSKEAERRELFNFCDALLSVPKFDAEKPDIFLEFF